MFHVKCLGRYTVCAAKDREKKKGATSLKSKKLMLV